MPPPNLYESDREKIWELGVDLNQKWFDLCRLMDLDKPGSQSNLKRMERWANEAVQRYEELGFKVSVDLTGAINGQKPPALIVEGRVEEEIFDHEKQTKEIRDRLH